MNIFNFISLLGGLAMFLYGMRLMGDSLKESSSGTLKKAMESVTNNHFKAFLLGVAVTAIIQSSTATIVITSGLVGAGIISRKQSLGVIVGANVGTTVTGQIIRLLDLNTASAPVLQFFKPSTLAPLALIIGIVLIMFIKRGNHDKIGNIAIGFGILFSGLLNMTGSVDALSETGIFESMFSRLGDSPVIGYLTGAGVAFILQSSSATIGILQAFSATGQLTFKAIYAVIVGIYLGDCVTTAIVCSIGAKSDAKRVGIINILFNLSETVLVLVVVGIVHRLGLLDAIWDKTINSGGIANTNTIFNLSCALVLFPCFNLYDRLSLKIVRDDPVVPNKYAEKLESLNPAFFATPALALNSCYDTLLTMFHASRSNIEAALGLFKKYDEKVIAAINEEEDNVDMLADRLSDYLVHLAPHISLDLHTRILDQYYKDVGEFERLSDHALNIAELATELVRKETTFSPQAQHELSVLRDLITTILDCAENAFAHRDLDAAKHIEPLEEVVDDMTNALRDNHLERLRAGTCNVYAGTDFLNLLTNLERISDVCSNIGVATVARAEPELATLSHEYVSSLHRTDYFNQQYTQAHDHYFSMLNEKEPPAEQLSLF